MAEKKEEFYTAPPKLTGWKSFSTFIWNSDTHQFLGRTGGSWAKIGLFYLVFYAFLAGFFAAMLIVFYQTLDYHQPRWQNVNGLIGKNPGLGFRPMPDEDHVESTLIWFKHGSGGNWQHWYSELEKFLKPYDTLSSSGEYFTSCSFDKLPQENKVCNFDIKLLGNACTKEESFGYERGRPCVILKLNKIYGWVPVPYNSSKVLPDKMPLDLKEYIGQREAADPLNMNMVWLSCEGEGPADRETIGNLTYTPFRGFPGYYFPYKNVPGYLSPIVAIQFQKPENGALINIECKVWAENIDQDRQRRLGSVHFELLMD